MFSELSPVFVVSQIIGVPVIIFCVIAPQLNDRRKMLACYFAANFLFAVNVSLMGTTSGIIVAWITCLRTLVYHRFSKDGRQAPAWVMLLFLSASLFSIARSYNEPADILSIGSAASCYGAWQKDKQAWRAFILFTTYTIGIYMLIHGMYTGFLNELFQFISAAVGLYRYRRLPNSHRAI